MNKRAIYLLSEAKNWCLRVVEACFGLWINTWLTHHELIVSECFCHIPWRPDQPHNLIPDMSHPSRSDGMDRRVTIHTLRKHIYAYTFKGGAFTYQRSARILDPGNSRRESASFFLARPREMIFWSLDLVSKHESNKMESRSRLEIREWSYDNLDLVSPGESKKNNSQSRLEKLHLLSRVRVRF